MNENSLTNCPKCGNPLTPGTSVCPVCGNQLDAQVTAAPVAQPVPVAQPEQPAPVQPVAQPMQQPMIAGPIEAPTIQSAPTVTAIPSVSAVNASAVTPSITPSQTTEKKGKVKLNNKTLIIILVLVLAGCGVFVFLNGKGGTTNVAKNPNAGVEDAETKDIVANGYNFKVELDWKVQSNSDNTIIMNSNENLIIKLEKYNYNLSSLSKDLLRERFDAMNSEYNPNRIDISSVDVTDAKIASKDAYIVNANVKENDGKSYAVQYYFINGGSDLVIGASVVYTNDEAKTNYEGKVTTLLNNLSFVNDSSSVITTINKNSKSFSVYFDAINGVNLQMPEEVNPEIPGEGENYDEGNFGEVVDEPGVTDQIPEQYPEQNLEQNPDQVDEIIG